MTLPHFARRLARFESARYLGVGACVAVLNNIVLIGGIARGWAMGR
jgi:hypothetical protein